MIRIGLWFVDVGALLIQVGFVSLFGCGFGLYLVCWLFMSVLLLRLTLCDICVFSCGLSHLFAWVV